MIEVKEDSDYLSSEAISSNLAFTFWVSLLTSLLNSADIF
jgi:hypothetical protein